MRVKSLIFVLNNFKKVLHGNTAIADKVWVHEGFLQMTVNFPGSMLTLQVSIRDETDAKYIFCVAPSPRMEIVIAVQMIWRKFQQC